MAIMAVRSDADQAQGSTRLILEDIINILKGTFTRSDQKFAEVQVWKLAQTTIIAASKKRGFCPEYRKMFIRALGAEDANRLLTKFNACVRRYQRDLKAKKKGIRFRFEQKRDKEKVLALLEKLKDATTGLSGFHIPYPGMGHSRVNTHLCTGR